MRSFFVCFYAWAAIFLTASGQVVDFPPLEDRYENIPQEAEDAYKSLKRLEARTEIGVNYLDYSRVIGDTYPDVKLFIESREAKNLPELRFVLNNAMDCYREVNRLWGIKVSSDSAIDKYNASMTLITAQPMLWRVAATNLSGAKAILEAEPGELEAAQKLIAAGADSLTLEGALRAAADEEIRLSREMRAKETGCPVPPAGGGPGLEEQVFPAGRIDGTFAAGAMTKRLTRIFDKVPPASEEGSVDVLQDGERQGMVTVFRYSDPTATEKAFDALVQNLGSKDRKPHRGLGNLAMVSEKAAVFRRGDIIVYTQGSVPQSQMLNMLATVDERIRKSFGEGEVIEPKDEKPVAEPTVGSDDSASRPAMMPQAETKEIPAETAPNKLESLLWADGDVSKGIEPEEFDESQPREFDGLPAPVSSGMYSLRAAGAHFGVVAALEYDDLEAAREIFTTWTSRPRTKAKISRVSGLGSKSYRREIYQSVELFFFRHRYLVFVSGPLTSDKDLVRLARRVDARIREARSEDKGDPAEAEAEATSAED